MYLWIETLSDQDLKDLFKGLDGTGSYIAPEAIEMYLKVLEELWGRFSTTIDSWPIIDRSGHNYISLPYTIVECCDKAIDSLDRNHAPLKRLNNSEICPFPGDVIECSCGIFTFYLMPSPFPWKSSRRIERRVGAFWWPIRMRNQSIEYYVCRLAETIDDDRHAIGILYEDDEYINFSCICGCESDSEDEERSPRIMPAH